MSIKSNLSAMFVMAAVILMVTASCSTAQENFSGKWVINEAKSTMPELPGNVQGQVQGQRAQGQGQGQARGGGMRLAAPEMTIDRKSVV